MITKVAGDRQGIQSIEVGFKLLNVLAAANRPMMLRDIAKGASMPAAKAHRYMVSFLRVGIVEQDAATGRYDLGEFALSLGLSGMARLDHVRLAVPVLDALCEKIHETVVLAVWGTHGATIVRIVDAGGPVTISIRAGTVMPLCTSATGQAFAAFSRAPYIKQMLDKELKEIADANKTSLTNVRRQFEKALTEFRERGVARATGSYTPGINGFSAPIFDHTGQMVAAITSLGTVGEFNAEWDSPVVQAMLASAEELSSRLGYRKEPV